MCALKRLTLDLPGGSPLLAFAEAWGLRKRSVEKVVGRVASSSKKAVISALGDCYDPCCRERRISVVIMGSIESTEIKNGRVRIEMVLTTGWCPFASRLLEMVTEEVEA